MATKELYLREGSAVWQFRFTGPDGSQIRRSTGKTDKREAQQVLDNAKVNAWTRYSNSPILVPAHTIKEGRLWGEAAVRWLEEREKRSIDTDAGRLGVLQPLMNDMLLTDITGDFVREKLINGLLALRQSSPATINRYVVLIQSILNLAYKEWRWIDSVPYLPRPGKTAESKRQAWLSPDQFHRIVKALPEHMADLALMGIATGLRYKNVNDLSWREIDVSRNCIVIPKEKFKGKRDHVFPINETARDVLIKYLGKHDERVFTFRGKPFERINLRHWHDAINSTGVNDELRKSLLLDEDEQFVFHGLRHTFATWLIRTGASIEVVEALGGWKTDSNRTVFNYAHTAGVNHLLPYSKRIDEILKGSKQEFSTVLAHDTWTKLAQLS